ncbi:hypothetical protein [Aquimarina sp. Aq78]|uniref:hypothetical protein n=1 Tax=Aquimarina sp. Aq78 TaxID=1191889 RepID=UPI000D103E48|nr:hypothetical protein [Aquimarina sp. Aq78]
MKLIYLLTTIIVTFLLMLLTSIALDSYWINKEISRKIIIYILMTLELTSGFLVARELLRKP